MKTRKFMTIWAAFSLLLAGWTSCVDDTSSLGGGNAPEIVITGMDPEKAVEVNSYTGVNLKDVIKPQVSANIPEDRLSYAWYLFSTADAEGNYRDFLVSSEKEPDYEINLKTGSYEVVFEVTSQADGYTQVATATLNASTTFSRGFYILKETPEGATELDLYSSGLYMPDLMEQMLGAPLAGKPYNLCTYYNGEYINPDNNETDYANFIYVFTEDKKFRGFRADELEGVYRAGHDGQARIEGAAIFLAHILLVEIAEFVRDDGMNLCAGKGEAHPQGGAGGTGVEDEEADGIPIFAHVGRAFQRGVAECGLDACLAGSKLGIVAEDIGPFARLRCF